MDIAEIGVREAHRRTQEDGAVYLDVRTEEEFAQGHPQGAVNVPVYFRRPTGMSLNPDFSTVVIANFSKDTKFVVGCRTGQRSIKGIHALHAEGFSDLTNVAGSMAGTRDAFGATLAEGWVDAGLPVSDQVDEQNSYEFLKNKKSG